MAGEDDESKNDGGEKAPEKKEKQNESSRRGLSARELRQAKELNQSKGLANALGRRGGGGVGQASGLFDVVKALTESGDPRVGLALTESFSRFGGGGGSRLGAAKFRDSLRRASQFSGSPLAQQIQLAKDAAGRQASALRGGAGGGGATAVTSSGSGFSGLGGVSQTPLDPTRFQRRKEDRMQRGELRGERLSDLRAQLAIEEEFKRRALRSRLRDLRGLLRGGRGDELTTTREELVNIAGRPEIRQTRETREVDRTQDLINLLLRG